MASYFPTLDISGEEFDFTHLEPFIMHVNSDMAKKVLKVQIIVLQKVMKLFITQQENR